MQQKTERNKRKQFWLTEKELLLPATRPTMLLEHFKLLRNGTAVTSKKVSQQITANDDFYFKHTLTQPFCSTPHSICSTFHKHSVR